MEEQRKLSRFSTTAFSIRSVSVVGCFFGQRLQKLGRAPFGPTLTFHDNLLLLLLHTL